MNASTLIKTLTVTAALFASTAQSAIVKIGTIKSLDLNSQTLVLDTGSRELSYNLSNSVDVNFLGEPGFSVGALEEGQRVKLKFADAPKALKGEVVAISHDDMMAQIKVKGSNKIETVKFAQNVSVSGINSFAALQKGHLVTVK